MIYLSNSESRESNTMVIPSYLNRNTNNNNNNNIVNDDDDTDTDTDTVNIIDSDSDIKQTDTVKLSFDSLTKLQLLNNYEVLNELGTGNYSKVKKGNDLKREKFVAVKILNKQLKNAIITNEIKIFKIIKNRHNNLIKISEIINDENSNKIYLILEYCSEGEIKWHPQNTTGVNSIGPSQFTFTRSREMFTDILQGLKFLHSLDIIHRDIKPSNLLISGDGTVKIADFGVSMQISTTETLLNLNKTVGTPVFYSPEICLGDNIWSTFKLNKDRLKETYYRIAFKIDIWALGITLYCILFGMLPFNSQFELDLFQMIIYDELKFPSLQEVKSIQPNPEFIPTKEEYTMAQNILIKILQKNPLDRYSIEEIENDPFFLTLRQTSKGDIIDGSSSIDEYDTNSESNLFDDHNTIDNLKNSTTIVELPINSSFASLDSLYIESFAMSQISQDNNNSCTSKKPHLRHSISSNLIMTPLEYTNSNSNQTISSDVSTLHFTSTKRPHRRRQNRRKNISDTVGETTTAVNSIIISDENNSFNDISMTSNFMQKSQHSIEQERKIKRGNFFKGGDYLSNESLESSVAQSSSSSPIQSFLSNDYSDIKIEPEYASVVSLDKLSGLQHPALSNSKNDMNSPLFERFQPNSSEEGFFLEISPRKARRGRSGEN